MSVTKKFHKYLPLLEETVEGTVFLDLKNPKLYKKLIRHYANEGVEFDDDGNSNEVEDHYWAKEYNKGPLKNEIIQLLKSKGAVEWRKREIIYYDSYVE